MRIDLGQARTRAKERVKAGRAARLAEAQRDVARELGYPSWPELVHALEPPTADRVLADAHERPERALALLEAAPALRDDPWLALSLGDASGIADATAAAGPLRAAPLYYLARSRIAGDTTTAARDLLARGADPNGPTDPDQGWTMLSVACSRGDVALVRLLLAAGANPDDNDSLYHSVEPREPDTLQALLEHGVAVEGTHALGHALDDERLEPVRLLLGAGAEPNEGSGYSNLHHAVVRRRSPAFVRLLAEHGADLARRDERGRTAYQRAVRLGLVDVAETLAELGSPTTVDAGDEALAAIARGGGDPSGLVLDEDAAGVLSEVATRDVATLERVVDAVGPAFKASWGGGPAGTLLHQAAWLGRPELVEALLRRGAPVEERVATQFDTPLGWAAVGSRSSPRDPDDSFAAVDPDYVAVARLLLDVGARVTAKDVDMAYGELHDWLDEQLG